MDLLEEYSKIINKVPPPPPITIQAETRNEDGIGWEVHPSTSGAGISTMSDNSAITLTVDGSVIMTGVIQAQASALGRISTTSDGSLTTYNSEGEPVIRIDANGISINGVLLVSASAESTPERIMEAMRNARPITGV